MRNTRVLNPAVRSHRCRQAFGASRKSFLKIVPVKRIHKSRCLVYALGIATDVVLTASFLVSGARNRISITRKTATHRFYDYDYCRIPTCPKQVYYRGTRPRGKSNHVRSIKK